jgi:tetratricopeptide (TPR) repeat protein
MILLRAPGFWQASFSRRRDARPTGTRSPSSSRWFLCWRYATRSNPWTTPLPRSFGVFVFLALAPCCSRDPERAAEQFVANGDRYATAGRLKDAAIEYRNAIKQTPGAVELHAKLAQVSARTSDVQTVVRELLQIAELAPTDPAAQVQAGSVYLLAGRFADARDRAEAALRVKGDDAPAHLIDAEPKAARR